MSAGDERGRRVDFRRVAEIALRNAEVVASGLCPDGRRSGSEWVARNPRRPEGSLGSFKINLATGRWADFAREDKGGDLVSLAAYVAAAPQRDAAIRLAESLGVDPYE